MKRWILGVLFVSVVSVISGIAAADNFILRKYMGDAYVTGESAPTVNPHVEIFVNGTSVGSFQPGFLTSGQSLVPFVQPLGQGGQGWQVTTRFAGGFSGTPPAGFEPWAVSEGFDPADVQGGVALSNANKTATFPAGSTLNAATLPSQTGGKRYFEFAMPQAPDNAAANVNEIYIGLTTTPFNGTYPARHETAGIADNNGLSFKFYRCNCGGNGNRAYSEQVYYDNGTFQETALVWFDDVQNPPEWTALNGGTIGFAVEW